MKPLFFKLIASLFVLLSVACSTGPVEEDIDPSVPEGDGLFSGKGGEVSLSDVFIGRRSDPNYRPPYYQGSVDFGDLPPMTEENFREFESFKAWLRSREQGTAEYQEYQDWRAYQQYRQYKAQQDQQDTEK